MRGGRDPAVLYGISAHLSDPMRRGLPVRLSRDGYRGTTPWKGPLASAVDYRCSNTRRDTTMLASDSAAIVTR